MSLTEEELRSFLDSNDPATVVEFSLKLCEIVLMPNNRYEDAEDVLFSALGLQSSQSGFIVELTLGKLYLLMNENSRAARFLKYAELSLDSAIKAEANTLLEQIGKQP